MQHIPDTYTKISLTYEWGGGREGGGRVLSKTAGSAKIVQATEQHNDLRNCKVQI